MTSSFVYLKNSLGPRRILAFRIRQELCGGKIRKYLNFCFWRSIIIFREKEISSRFSYFLSSISPRKPAFWNVLPARYRASWIVPLMHKRTRAKCDATQQSISRTNNKRIWFRLSIFTVVCCCCCCCRLSLCVCVSLFSWLSLADTTQGDTQRSFSHGSDDLSSVRFSAENWNKRNGP